MFCQEFVAMLCREAESKQHEGFAPVGRQGVHEAFLKHRCTSGRGTPLGFEPLLSDCMPSCSWLCNGLETVVAEQLRIQPNGAGLIETNEEVRSAMSSFAREEISAEPGLWLPWLIIHYSTDAEP